jgi:hypothetical protein
MFKLILWIIVGVLALSFFGISLKAIINSPAGQENIAYSWELLILLWQWIISLFGFAPEASSLT